MNRICAAFCVGIWLLTIPALASPEALLDYSYCGYKLSQEALPYVPTKAAVAWQTGDRTAAIQAAIDYVSTLPADAQGFRGAVQLDAGRYELSGGLSITASGVVLRGCGGQEGGTELVGVGTHRTTLIRLSGSRVFQQEASVSIAKEVPVGAMMVEVAHHAFREGDEVRITREATQAWIDLMNMNDFGGESDYIGWKPARNGKPSDVNIYWERRIVRIEGNRLYLDAPLTCHIAVGEGSVAVYRRPGRIGLVGVENLSLRSTFDSLHAKDENHRWVAIALDDVEDAWVRRVSFHHFAGSAVFITESSRRITVEDCRSLAPVSEIGGQRRYTFHTLGGQCLFQRLYSEQGFHDFSVGRCCPGPTAFVHCQASQAHHFSGTIDAWATGVLFDNFRSDDGMICLSNRGQDGMGAGWTAAYSTLWNVSARLIAVANPPTAENHSIGSLGRCEGAIQWQSREYFVQPKSLFYAQLAERSSSIAREPLSEACSPQLEALAIEKPSPKDYTCWQSSSSHRPNITQLPTPKMTLCQGRYVYEGRPVIGRQQGIVWWNGSQKERHTVDARPHITRWVTGRVGTGFTDDLDQMTDDMKAHGVVLTEHHYGLWYDRRRDDHERIRRMDGYVWAPFYEQPFARSGQGRAYDGLSRYDLTRWNDWYWYRLKEYADLADRKGLVLFHQYFFQHNILEAGAHWADCPWRSANNINDTGFPEPVPYAVDKRIYMAEQFYDVSHPQRRELYRNYIRKALDEFADNGSVLHSLSAEYTGPLHFVQFWLDVIAEWEAETGRQANVVLSVPKNVQDAILADEKRAAVVDAIDIRYWRPTMTGFYAPQGGLNLAPRQNDRLRVDSFHQTAEVKAKNIQERYYEVVLDYRTRFPEKAVICSGGDAWMCFMAGASFCALPSSLPHPFLASSVGMMPISCERGYALSGKKGKAFIAYSVQGLSLDLRQSRRSFKAQWFNPKTGRPEGEEFRIKGGKVFQTDQTGVLWLH